MKLQDPFESFDSKYLPPNLIHLSEHYNRTIDEMNTLLNTLHQTLSTLQNDIDRLNQQLKVIQNNLSTQES